MHFRSSFSLIFGLRMPDLVFFDFKSGFYVEFPPRNRLERSRIWSPGPKMRKFIFQHDFFLIRGLGYPGAPVNTPSPVNKVRPQKT